MTRSTTDIVARLALNGSSFSSETQRLFGQLQAGARSSATELTRIAGDATRQIEEIAKKAAAAPRAASGSLTIDVGGARQAAAAAEAEAVAMREVASAAERVALQKGKLTERESAYIMGARQAAAAAEEHARAMMREAQFADLLQAELTQTASATALVIDRNRALNGSMRGSGMAIMQASQQVQDFWVQVGAGANPLTAFSQQIGQLAFVVQGADGVVGKFGKFLAGGWGSLVMTGLAILSLFADKIVSTGTEVEKATKELEKNAKATKTNKEAQQAFAKTAEGVSAAIDEMNEALGKNIVSQTTATDQALRDAEAKRLQQIEIRKTTIAFLKLAEAQFAASRSQTFGAAGGAGAGMAQVQYAKRVEELQAKVKAAEEALAKAEKAVNRSMIQVAEQEARAAVDPLAKINQLYDRMADKAKLAAENNRKLAASLKDTLTGIEKQRAAALEAERDRQAAQRKSERDASKVDQRVRLLDPVSGRVTSGFGQRAAPKAGASTNHLGVDYAVPTGTGVRAGAAGVVVSVGNMGKLGKAVVVDYGDKTIATYGHLSEILVGKGQAVSAGDLIARSGNTGNSTGPHLHYGLRVDGRPVDPRGRTVRQGAGVKAQDEQARELAEQEKQYQRLLAISQQQLSVEAESLRFLGLKVRGLDEQAALEGDLARSRHDYAEQMAQLTANQREEQGKVTAEVTAAARELENKAAIYANLRVEARDLSSLTDDQRKTLDAANTAMLDQLELARGLAKTAAERQLIEEAILRAKSRMTVADAKGNDLARDEKRAAEELARELEDQRRDHLERQRDQIYSLASFYRDAFREGGKGIAENFKDEMLDVISEVAARWTLALLSGQKTSLGSILSEMGATSGVGGGGLIGGLLGGLAGGKKAGAASLVPGIGDLAAAKAGGGLLGGLGGIGGAISSALPYAAIAMAVLPIISSLFSSPKWGSAGLSLNGGVVSGGQGIGKGSSQIKGATGAAGSVADGVNRLAEQLGANISGIPGVTIGTWDGKARVALTSTSEPLHAKSKAGKAGLIKDFGEGGEAEALKFAIEYVFTNAALDGISQASKNIIKAGGADVSKAIEKALLIEDIPKRLQSKLDPVGYAIDQLNKQWDKTIAALIEGGASAEQMADAQKLYKIELAETKAAARAASADLKEFLNGLNFGSNSPYSLRDQERMAAEALKPFEEAILKGERVDQGQYTAAAQQWLDLQRELFGSTGKFFEGMDRIQSLTGKAISDIDNAKPIRVETDPFVKSTAANTQASAELLEQISRQTAETNALLARLAGGSGYDGFIGGYGRNFLERSAA